MTGIYKVADGTTPATVQATVNGFSVYSEDCLTTGYRYTNNSFPQITEADILTDTYYDTYGYPGVKTFDTSVNISGYSDGTGNSNYFDVVKGKVTGTRVKALDGNENNSNFRWLVTTNFYDDRYRVIETVKDLYATDATYSEVVSSQYDFTGRVLQSKLAQTFGSTSTVVNKYLTYDPQGRLIKTEQEIENDANGRVTTAENVYNEIGQLIDKKLHKVGSSYLQDVNYAYNIRGWLKSINDPDNLSGALFGERLLYEIPESGLNVSTDAQYNGIISGMVWNSDQKSKQGYRFTYDGINRLTLGDYKYYSGGWNDNNNYEEKSLAYDLNGNISRLQRTDNSGGYSADFTYAYSGNQLTNINSGTSYTYDQNGNTTFDGLRGMSIGYNVLNLPNSITKSSDNISYIYSANGEKLAKKDKYNLYQYYAGSMVYNNDKSLNYILFEEGMVNKSSVAFTYEYHLKDHLGNTRVTFQPNGGGTTTTQVAEYYPFGSSYSPISPAGTNKYLYNGKEKQDDVLSGTALDEYDYGARFYDPTIGRWHVIDKLIEKYYSVSGYSYGVNNPISNIDFEGNFVFKGASNFPELNRILQKVQNVLDNSNIMSNLQKFTGLNSNVIRNQFSYGNGPEIVVKDLWYNHGSTPPESKGMLIKLDYADVLALSSALKSGNKDDYNIALFQIIAIILHEYVHSGDFQAHGKFKSFDQPENCLGYQFEEETFGDKLFNDRKINKFMGKRTNFVEADNKNKDNESKNSILIATLMSLAPGDYVFIDGKIVPKKK